MMSPLSPPENQAIPVVLGFTDNFSLYAYTTMRSALNHALPGVNLAFYALHTGLSEKSQVIGKKLFTTDRSSIEFVDVSKWFENIHPPHMPHASPSTFFRLSIPDLFQNFERVIYLDSDILVRSCLSNLFYAINAGRMIGAARDLLLKLGQADDYCLPYEVGGGVRLVDYHKGALGVQNSDDYFQAGVLVFNPSIIPEEKRRDIRGLITTLFWMMDQDILNRVFYGNVYFISQRWNACLGPNSIEEAQKLPRDWRETFNYASKDPNIVHFTAFPKPWNGWNGLFTDEYRDIFNPIKKMFESL